MDKDSLKPQQSLNSFENKNENEQEIKNEKNENSFLDNMGFDAFFTLIDDDNNNMQNKNNDIKESRNNNNNKEDINYKISIDLSDIKNTKIHNYLNEDLIDAIDKSFDEPKENQCMSDLSHNENETNYSQNNMSNDNDMFNNNYSTMSNNYQFQPQNMNTLHKSITFFPKMNKKKQDEENNTNINNTKNITNDNNLDDKNKNIKKLVDYFGGNNLLDAPIYIPHKFKSLKFNQKPHDIGDNTNNNNYNNNEYGNDNEIKEEKCKKPFEIREGDWTCELCYNLNFAFRTKCNRCGYLKDFLNIRKNLCMNNNDNFHYNKLMQTNLYVGNSQNAYHYMKSNNYNNNIFSSPNNSNFP